VWLLAANCGIAQAQTGSQLGTSRVPANPADQVVKPPSAAPTAQPQKPGPTKSQNHPVAAPPVVAPHGPTRLHKPVNAAAPRPSVPVQPQKPAAPPADADTTAKALPPEKLPDPEKPEGVPARLPRFASLRSDDVNMRVGPGTRYRIEWVYKRRDLPVRIEREFDVWRWVRDPEGIQGWVHQATLMGRRNFIVQKVDATLRSDPADSASAVAILKPGVIGRIRVCDASSEWCSVQTASYRGYLRRAQFWGLLPGEAIAP
jgi:SH3-like domain-containing protein